MKKAWIIVTVLIGIFLFYTLTMHLVLNLNGDEYIEIDVFDEYNEKGAYSCYSDIFGFCLYEPEIKISGNVDTTKLGEYTINYMISSSFHQKQIQRKVTVVDKEKPLINVTQESILTCPNNNDFEVAYSAFDNYDLDITDKVIEKIENDEYILEVFDSSGNSSTLTLPIIYVDDEKPTIKLKGDKTIYLLKGEKYKELGFSASDNCLGNITDRVKISNNVDSDKVGKYTISYTVSDDLNNTTKLTRTVYVYEKNPDVPIGDKVIYLTFDDGPSKYTEELLDILKKYNVKATFFVTSNGSDDTIKRAYEEGHSIGLHTYSHNYSKVYQSVDAYFNDLNKISSRVEKITGEKSMLIRFPGGSSNTVSKFNPGIMTTLAKEVEVRGYKYFDWNVGSSDTSTSDSSKIANNVIKSLKKGSNIVLQHDTNYSSVKAVSEIIEYGLNNGYVFAPLDITSPSAHHTIAN